MAIGDIDSIRAAEEAFTNAIDDMVGDGLNVDELIVDNILPSSTGLDITSTSDIAYLRPLESGYVTAIDNTSALTFNTVNNWNNLSPIVIDKDVILSIDSKNYTASELINNINKVEDLEADVLKLQIQIKAILKSLPHSITNRIMKSKNSI